MATSNVLPSPEMLLAKLQVLHKARLQAEAEALAAAAAVDLTIPLNKSSYSFSRDGLDSLHSSSSGDSSLLSSPPKLISGNGMDNDWCRQLPSHGPRMSPESRRKRKNISCAIPSENTIPDAYSVEVMQKMADDCENLVKESLNFQFSTPLDSVQKEVENYSSDEAAAQPEMFIHQTQADLGGKKPRQKRGTATDPQSLAARARREKIASKIRRLQDLIPGTDKLDTATVLEYAIDYVKHMQAYVGSTSSGHSSDSDQLLSFEM